MDDYKEKYENLIEQLKKEKEEHGGYTFSSVIDKIVPELKESEGERIRKDLINYFRDHKPLEHKEKDVVAWLEKQGEQKPDDKVEPKFKVGDWVIVQDKTPCQIEKVTELPHNHYQYWTTDEHWFGDGTEARLWTIQDAKDGDILMANAPFIFNGNLEGGIGCPGAHCAINTLGKFQVPKYQEHWTGHTTTPATKEQRDLLFQKMKEAGYEWDAEKKELTKINKQICYHNDGLYYAIDILEKTFGKVEGYQSDDGIIEHQTAIETVSALYHKKPAWSEEDEEILNNIITAFKRIGENCEHYFSPYTAKVFEKTLKSLKDIMQSQLKQDWSEEDERIYQSILDDTVQENQLDGNQFAWLKSIKDRVQPQPKQEWSEEDSERLLRIHQFIWANRKGDTDEIYQQEQDADWLKSLKPNHWKPNKEQMEALEKECFAHSNYQLCRLLEDLKNL